MAAGTMAAAGPEVTAVECAACGTANPAGSRFCNTCGARLEPATTTAESRRTVTVVFVDVAGSTALGERLDPESLRAIIGEFFDLAKAVVERHGGIVEKFIGDAVMAVFGLPTLHEDDALRAVRAAAELRDRLAASHLAGRVAIRTGVNTGEVVAGDASDGQRLVTGDAVNTAARLEQAAEPGEILLGATTYRLVREGVEAEEATPVDAKGKSEAVRAFRLTSVDPAGELTTRHLDAPLVGRERELTRLLRSFDDAVAERRCGLFTLLGPAGVGKSRLVYELLTRVGDRATILRGRSLPYGEGITYWPIAEMVRSAAGIEDADDRDAALAKLRAVVAATPDADEVVDRIATAVGIVTGETDREDVFRAVRRLFEVLAAHRPLVVVFDDLQWAEPTLVDLVEHVVDWSRGSPILVVVLARPELLDARPDWGGGKLDSQMVLLEGLGEGDTRELARSLLGGGEVDERLLDRVEAVAEGNPLFVEQLVAMLVEDGHLVRVGEGWQLAGRLETVPVPPTIAALLAARLDRLPRDERVLAERASVVGRIFEQVAVAELSPELERAELPGRLRNLVRRELIRPDPSSVGNEETFRFRHILIRDAAYDALSKRDRADLHGRFASWLEATAAGRLAEYEEIVGYHLDQAVRYRVELGFDDGETAGLRERAFRRLAAAGARAFERQDLPAAIRLLARSIEHARAGTIAHVDELLELGVCYWASYRFADAVRALADAREAALTGGDPARAARADVLAAAIRMQSDPTMPSGEVEAIADALEPVLERTGYGPGLVDLWVLRGHVALNRLQMARATVAYEKALAENERSGVFGWRDFIHTWIANTLFWGPTPASVAIARIRELLPRTRSRRMAALIRMRIATLTAYQGRVDDARSLMADARATLTDLGLEAPNMGSAMGPAFLEMTAGNLEGAAETLAAGRAYLLEVGETGVRSTIEGMLSLILARLGRDEEAIAMSDSSEASAAPDDDASQILLRLGRALAYAHMSRTDLALDVCEPAIAMADRSDQIGTRAMAYEVRGAVLLICGRAAEARDAYERAIELFEQKENVAGAALARDAQAAIV